MKSISAMVGILFVAISMTAVAKQPVKESVLPPGAKVVAGDLSKNEFFILSKEQLAQAKAAAGKAVVASSTQSLEPKTLTTKVVAALHKQKNLSLKKTATPQLALAKAVHKTHHS